MIEPFCQAIEKHCPGWTPRCILEVGTRDCEQSIELANHFPNSEIWAFEADPINHDKCRVNAAKNSSIHFVPLAVSGKDGPITFFRVTTNDGAGSIFKPDPEFKDVGVLPSIEIVVQSTRLDTFILQNGIPEFDTLWLDAQGAELEILKSLGNYINQVKAICTEVEWERIYSNQPLLPDVKQWLSEHGFTMIYAEDHVKDLFGEACFLRL